VDDKVAETMWLPTNRAFVVQLASRDGADPFRGRVEHLASGSVIHFDSLASLGTFIAHVLDSSEPQPATRRDAAPTTPGNPGGRIR
jgi:hypothetical protein